MDWLIPTAYAADGTNGTTDYAAVGFSVLIGIGVVAVALVIGSILRSLVERAIAQRQGDQHKELRILYGRIVLTIAGVIGVLAGLQVAGAKLEWFAGALGLGLGLAFQNVLGNFIAGIVLLTQDKFNIGDYVVIVGGSGTVGNLTGGFSSANSGTITDISARSTTLLALDGGQITVPNIEMLTSKILCYTKNPVRRIEIEIGVGYGADLKKASEIILDVMKRNHSVELMPEPMVIISSIAASSVMFIGRFWVESKMKWWSVKSDLTRDIFNALTAAGIDIPYPVNTLRVDKFSSDILAGDSHLLDNLRTIENEKAAAFTAVPDESVAAPAASAIFSAEQTSANSPTGIMDATTLVSTAMSDGDGR